jgi:hypothetical protein
LKQQEFRDVGSVHLNWALRRNPTTCPKGQFLGMRRLASLGG